jgi:hypothetical protein
VIYIYAIVNPRTSEISSISRVCVTRSLDIHPTQTPKTTHAMIRRNFIKKSAFTYGSSSLLFGLINASGAESGNTTKIGNHDCASDFTIEFQGSYTESRTRTYRLYKNGNNFAWVATGAATDYAAPVGTTPATFDVPGTLDDTWDLDGDKDANDLPGAARGCTYEADGAPAAPVTSPGGTASTFKNNNAKAAAAHDNDPRHDAVPGGGGTWNMENDTGTLTETKTTTWKVTQKYKILASSGCNPAAGAGGPPASGHSLPTDVTSGASDIFDPPPP